jgi:hypothetical protein
LPEIQSKFEGFYLYFIETHLYLLK